MIYLFYFSCVFWFGDLNFRLDHSKLISSEEIVRSIKVVDPLQKTAITLTDVWTQDELSSAMEQSRAFQGFFETIPMFPPTYRFTVGSCDYDLKYVFTMHNTNNAYISLTSKIEQ